VWCIYHEGVGEAVEGHAEIGSNAVFPNVFNVDAVFVLETHLGQAAPGVSQ
jgi:hypothetical protein